MHNLSTREVHPKRTPIVLTRDPERKGKNYKTIGERIHRGSEPQSGRLDVVVSAAENAYLEKLGAKSNDRIENEKNISTAQAQAPQHAWVPSPDGNEERTESHQPSASQRTQEAQRE